MNRRKALIPQADLTRIWKAAVSARVPVYSTTIKPDGSVLIVSAPDAKSEATGWEDVT